MTGRFSTRQLLHLGEKNKLNLKCLLTSFSFNFDHKLIEERCVRVFLKVKVAELVDQRGQSALGGFFGSVCSSVNAANENKKRDLIS